MFKLKCDDFLIYDEATGTYSMSAEQQVRDQTERNRWKTTGLTILKDWRLYLMLVPMMLVYLLWKYMPMYELIAVFKDTSGTGDVLDKAWTGLTNFRTIISGPEAPTFWKAFRNTFALSFYNLLFGFPMPIILALFFNEVRSNILRSVLQVCVYLPKFMSTVVITTLTLALFRAQPIGSGNPGIVSRFLLLLAGNNTEFKDAIANGLLFSPRYFRTLYVVTELWEHAGYDSIVFFAAVIAVSPTSYEAAQIDGAGKMAQMRYVVLPGILSTVVIMLIMKIGGLLSVGYEKVYLLLYESNTISNYEVADIVATYANAKGDAIGMAAEMMNNLMGMVLVLGANAVARKASDVSLY